jgi:hypothetical protein
MNAMYNEVVLIRRDLSSSIFSDVISVINSPTRSGISDPCEVSKIIVGIPAIMRSRPRNLK